MLLHVERRVVGERLFHLAHSVSHLLGAGRHSDWQVGWQVARVLAGCTEDARVNFLDLSGVFVKGVVGAGCLEDTCCN